MAHKNVVKNLIDESLNHEEFHATSICPFPTPLDGFYIDISQIQQMVLKTDVNNRLMGLDVKLIKFGLVGSFWRLIATAYGNFE